MEVRKLQRGIAVGKVFVSWRLYLVCVLLALAVPLPTHAANRPGDGAFQVIQSILEKPEEAIDLADAKLVIDHLIDPSIDVQGTSVELDRMAADIRRMAGINASSRQRLDALLTFLYKPGPWNVNRRFQYDFSDPMGKAVANKLISNYLATRRGNCVSMPLLVIILGQKLGLTMTASLAPLHVFVKYRNEAGKWVSLEATGNGDLVNDVWYQKNSPMTQRAVRKGVYLRPLSKKEVVTVIAESLMQSYMEHGQYEPALSLGPLLLKYHPSFADVMLHQSAAYYRLADVEFFSRYASEEAIPRRLKRYRFLTGNFIGWQDKATALGWWRPAEEEDQQYLQRVDKHPQTSTQ